MIACRGDCDGIRVGFCAARDCGSQCGLLIFILAGLVISVAMALMSFGYLFMVLEITFWLLAEDRSFRLLALPFIIAGAVILLSQRNAFTPLSLGE